MHDELLLAVHVLSAMLIISIGWMLADLAMEVRREIKKGKSGRRYQDRKD